MKQKIVFTAIFNVLALFSVGQSIDEVYLFAEKQFDAGNYPEALTEYQRVAFFDTENRFEKIYEKTGDLFYLTGDFESAIRNYNIAGRIEKSDSAKIEIQIKKALCFFRQENYLFAVNELISARASQSGVLRDKLHLYTGVAWFGAEEYSEALDNFAKLLPDEEVHKLENIFIQFEKRQKRFRPGKIETLSIIFPGLGQLYCGDIINGINSVILVGSLAVLGIWAWQTYGVLDALLSVGPWYYRYYTGGIQNAKAAAYEKIAHEKEHTYGEIIQLVENSLKPVP